MKFSLRDVLWLIVAASLAISWWADRHKIEDERQLVRKQLQKLQEQREALAIEANRIDKLPQTLGSLESQLRVRDALISQMRKNIESQAETIVKLQAEAATSNH